MNATSTGPVEAGAPGRPVPLDLLAAGERDATAIVLNGETTSYGELSAKVAAARRGLVSLGLRPGAVVAWAGLTSIEAIACELAVTSTGLTWAPLGARLTAAELVDRISRLAPSAFLYDVRTTGRGAVAERVIEALDTAGAETLEIGIGGPGRGIAFDSLVDIGLGMTRDPEVVRHDGPDRVQFTSGTSSAPKAAALTTLAMMRNAASMAEAMRLTGDDAFYNPLPLDHAAGYCTLLTMFRVGGTSVMSTYFDADEAVALMRSHSCTAFRGVDATYMDMVAAAGDDPPWIRTGVISTANPTVRERVLEVFGFEDGVQLYGMTECSGPATMTDAGDPDAIRLETHGKPVEGMQARIHQPNADGVGEIQLRGDRLMVGYLEDPGAMAETFAGGWLATGDLGTMVDGQLTYLGRRKEIIRVGGENVSCAEIESVLLQCPGVASAAAFPLPDERLGEVVGAAIVPEASGLDIGRIEAELSRRMARFKLPREIHTVSELPQTGSGKIRRRDLSERYGGTTNGKGQ